MKSHETMHTHRASGLQIPIKYSRCKRWQPCRSFTSWCVLHSPRLADPALSHTSTVQTCTCCSKCASLVCRQCMHALALPQFGQIKPSSALVCRERQKSLIHLHVCVYVKLKNSQLPVGFLFGVGVSLRPRSL